MLEYGTGAPAESRHVSSAFSSNRACGFSTHGCPRTSAESPAPSALPPPACSFQLASHRKHRTVPFGVCRLAPICGPGLPLEVRFSQAPSLPKVMLPLVHRCTGEMLSSNSGIILLCSQPLCQANIRRLYKITFSNKGRKPERGPARTQALGHFGFFRGSFLFSTRVIP